MLDLHRPMSEAEFDAFLAGLKEALAERDAEPKQ